MHTRAYYYKQFFPIDQVDDWLVEGIAIDGTCGGLILGPPHEDGGINMLQFIGSGYSLVGEIEGYEFFLNPAATPYFFKSFSHLNNKLDITSEFDEYPVPSGVSILDTRLNDRSIYNSKFLIFVHRFSFGICNKHSTRKHLTILNNLNSSVYHQYDNPEYSLTTRMNIFQASTNDKIWSIRHATKDDDPTEYL